MAWEFRILGSIEICRDGVAVDPGPTKQRCVLTALLLEPNRVVPVDRLVTAVWEGTPPRSAVANVRTYASRLRALLTTEAESSLLHSRPPGYLLTAGEDELDLTRFARHATVGRAALHAGRLPEAENDLRAALGLWRGAAAEDLSRTSGLGDRLAVLDEQRLAVLEDWIETRQRLGEDTTLLAELRQLTIDHPLRERFWHQLITSLYRSGDIGGALRACEQARLTLADQLGLDPGPGLTRLHRAVLARDPALTLPAQSERPAHSAAVPAMSRIPRELPPDSSAFVGRSAEVAEMLQIVRSDDPPSVIAVHGPIGVGKSAYAVHLAHRLASSYEDGQIYVDLRDPPGDLPTRRPVDLLGRLLRALGVPDDAVPSTEEEAAARLRSLTATRRMIFVLDNTRDEGQVRPLLPGAGECLLIVTSRRILTGLDNAHHVELSRLSRDDAMVLLSRLCGSRRVMADPEHAGRVVELCDRLPLALRAAGAWLAARATWPIATLAGHLADERTRLDSLDFGGLAVRPRLDSALRELADPTGRRLFRLLGALRLTEVSVPVAAALMNLSDKTVEPLLDQLGAARLIEQVAVDRYRLDGLIRVYAEDLARAHDHAETRAAAIDRVLTHYLEGARRAAAIIQAASESDVTESVVPARHTFVGRAVAQSWLDAEFVNLTTLARRSAIEGYGSIQFAPALLRTLRDILNTDRRRNALAELAALSTPVG